MKLSRNWVGALLATTTAILWAALPLAMKQVLQVTDAPTIVWIRFLVAAVWMWVWLAPITHRPTKFFVSPRYVVLFCIAAVGLGGNFVFFNASVRYLSAPAAQIIGQAGPVLFFLGSVFILREPLGRVQVAGMAVLLTGLGMFFNQHIGELVRIEGEYVYGLFLGILAAISWASYAIAQKALLRTVTPKQIMRFIYTCCAIGFFPLASPADLLQVNLLQAISLIFCCGNTLVAYGAFSEALVRWEATKVSALLTLSPLYALLFSEIAWWVSPVLFPTERLNLLGIAGAFVVVTGALAMTRGPGAAKRSGDE